MGRKGKIAIVIIALLIITGFILYKNKNGIISAYKSEFSDVHTDYPKKLKGTAAMISYLNAHALNVQVFENKHANDLRLKELLNMPIPENPERAIELRCMIAREYLNFGDPNKARQLFAQIVKDPDFKKMPLDLQTFYLHMYAVSSMRYGEIQNCISNHNAESCVFPIVGNGVHQDKSGSLEAIEVYMELLNAGPKNSPQYLISLWLLNVAYMTLGEYPDKVPPEYLIKDLGKDSGYPIGKFLDVAMSAGVGQDGLSGGVAADDFNNDGYIDIFTSGWQFYEQLTYYENNKDGTFTDKTEQAGLKGLAGGLNMIHADYDNDGNMDVYVMRGGWWDNYGSTANSLIRNNGDGTFTDITKHAGLLSFHPCQTARFDDFNNDGYLDLINGNESSRGSPGHPVELFMNTGKGKFKNMAEDAGIDIHSYIKGIATGDFDNDGYVDIAFSIYMSPNKLFRNTTGDNNGKIQFEDVTKQAGIRGPIKSFPTWFFDVDNDGDLDLYIAAFDNERLERIPSYILKLPYERDISQLYINNGDGTFIPKAKEYHLDQPNIAMGANFGDLDNDGWLDFYLGTGNPDFKSLIPNLMYRNNGGKDFQDVTYTGGFGHLQKGHGIAFADFDMDGDQDIYEVLGGANMGDNFMNILLENPGSENKWIAIDLVGTRSNRDGIGAKITLSVEFADGSQRKIFNTMNTGASFGSSPLRKEIGLGNATRILSLEILWPSGTRQVFSKLNFNTWNVITEDSETVDEKKYSPFKFKKATHHTEHNM